MAYCSHCRSFLRVEFIEFLQRSAWCPKCRTVVAVSLCKVPVWVLGVITLLLVQVY